MSFTARLAYFPIPAVDSSLARAEAPGLLVSYVYLEQFLKVQGALRYRDWVLDSGAFSAFNSGTVISLDAYIARCKVLMETDQTLTEIFALDVIGDWKGTLANTEKMWAAGVPAIPTFHRGEPDDYLRGIARDYPKIALGGVARLRGSAKLEWAERCFGVVWPKRVHGFGFGGREAVMALPWHSVDATNWEMGPCAFGNWQSFGDLRIRGSQQDLRAEIEFYMKMEREAQSRWRREMALLDAAGPALRLAMSGTMTTKPGKDALASPLAVNGKSIQVEGVSRVEKAIAKEEGAP